MSARRHWTDHPALRAVRWLFGHFTLIGILAIAFSVVVVLLAAEATARNRLEEANYCYVLLALLLALLVLSLPLLRWNLTGLRIEREIPDRMVAGEPFPVTLRITNRSFLWPRLALELEDGLPSQLRRAARQSYVIGIPPRQTVLVRYQGMLFVRGELDIKSVRVTSRFPFGLISSGRSLPCTSRVLVYPAVGEFVSLPALPIGSHLAANGLAHPRRDAIDQYFGVREYRDGDHPRTIHWKATARRGSLVVREFESETLAPVLILLDTRIWQRTRRGFADAELAVSYAATLATHYGRLGHSVALAGFMPQPVMIQPGHGSAHTAMILETLATLRTTTRQYFDELLGQLDPRQTPRMHAIGVLLGHRSLYQIDAFQGRFRSLSFFSVQDPEVRSYMRLREHVLQSEMFDGAT